MSQTNSIEKKFENREPKSFDSTIYKKLLTRFKMHKKLTFWCLFSCIACAVMDTVIPLMYRDALQRFVSEQRLSEFPPFFILLFSAYVFLAILIAWSISVAGKFEAEFSHAFMRDCFDKLQKLSYTFFDNTSTGWILARLTSDISNLSATISWQFFDLFWSGGSVVFAFIAMFILNPKVTIVILLITPFIFGVSLFINNKIIKGNRVMRKTNSKILSNINESVNGVRTTKTLVREEKNFEDFQTLTTTLRKASLHVGKYSALYFPIINLLVSTVFAAIFIIGGKQVTEKTLNLATFSLLITYVTQTFERLRYFTVLLIDVLQLQVSAERVFSLLESEENIKDTESVIEIYGDAFNPKRENWEELEGDIEFKNVSFYYNKEEPVLNNFNLKINKGEKIAFVGETGSGKSTIVNLICRFYEATEGEILIDGKNINERSQLWLHSNIGYVLQSPQLFSGTVTENIRYGKLDATDDEIIAIAKLVDAYDFVMELENGFDTNIGEGGSRLSSGQRQLISFARAIIAEPKIFILDEATSSVDTETEQKIQNSITKVLEGRTSFIIAHRLSTIRFCDRIIAIKDGEILEMGSHKELLKAKGYYYNLYTNQFIETEQNKLLA